MDHATTGSTGYAADVKQAFSAGELSADEHVNHIDERAATSKPRQKSRRKKAVDAEAEDSAKRRCTHEIVEVELSRDVKQEYTDSS